MNKTLRYFGLCYLQAVGVLAAAGAGFAVGRCWRPETAARACSAPT